jgi:hypothetical protein
LVYWDADLGHAQWWRYATSENSNEIMQDLISPAKSGTNVICSSITSDGGTGIRKAVEMVYPNIPHQRCITHVQRLGLALLTRNPKTRAGQELRPLVKTITQIENESYGSRFGQQRDEWVNQFLLWCNRWDSFLKERSYLEGTRKWWYAHKSLRRARVLILNALPNLFYYLEDNTIPKDTNGLEGRFSIPPKAGLPATPWFIQNEKRGLSRLVYLRYHQPQKTNTFFPLTRNFRMNAYAHPASECSFFNNPAWLTRLNINHVSIYGEPSRTHDCEGRKNCEKKHTKGTKHTSRLLYLLIFLP